MIANFDQEMQSQSWDAAIQAYTATETAAQQTSAKAEQILYIRDDEYQHLEEDSYQAESLAEDAYQQYRTAESKSALLAAEVDDKRTAAKLSAALAEDALSSRHDSGASYSELLDHALEALLTVSANAESELQEKEKQYAAACNAQQNLLRNADMARLTATLAKLRAAYCHQTKCDAEHQITLSKMIAELSLCRRSQAERLRLISNLRPILDELLAEYEETMQEAKSLQQKEEHRKYMLAELTERLAASGAEILPYEEKINQLESEKNSLQREFDKINADAERAERFQRSLAETLAAKEAALEQIRTNGEIELHSMRERNERETTAAGTALSHAQVELSMVSEKHEQTRNDLTAIQAELAVAEERMTTLRTAEARARSTMEKTLQMIESAKAAQQAMKSDSGDLLTGAASILQTTLATASK